MTIPYPLPPMVPPPFVSSTIHLPPGYSIRIDGNGVHYLTFGGEDLLGAWPFDTFDDAEGVRAVRREIAKLIETHQEKAKNWKLPEPDGNQGEPES